MELTNRLAKQRTNKGRSDRPETAATETAFPEDLQADIGRRLRAHYDSILAAPIPDRIAELMERLGKDEDKGER